jgi:hypothetical protein
MVLRLRRRMNMVGVLTTAALLAGQLSTLLHILVVEHQRCPEHGELVHAPVRRSPPSLLAALALAGTADRPTLIAPADAASEDSADDHCLSLAHRRDALVNGAVAQKPIILQNSARATTPPPAIAPLARLWMLAPKTSPPLAA